MQTRRSFSVVAAFLGALVLLGLVAWQGLQARPPEGSANVIVITSAQVATWPGEQFPSEQPPRRVTLPDDWAVTHPRADGPVWYRLSFQSAGQTDELLSAAIDRVCSNAEVWLNGFLVHRSGRMTDPVARNCYRPLLVNLSPGLVRGGENHLDIKVQGYALQKVSSRLRAGGLSQVRIGPQALLQPEHETHMFWNITLAQGLAVATTVLGVFLLYLRWFNRHEAHLSYLGLTILMWNLLMLRSWAKEPPFDNASTEMLVCVGVSILTALVVQFLLSYSHVRSRVIEALLLLQCLMVPLSLVLAGPLRLYHFASAWNLLMVFEMIGAMVLYLRIERRAERGNFWPMAILLGGLGTVMLIERATQFAWFPLPEVHVLQFVPPIIFAVIGSRQLSAFALALRSAEVARNSVETRVAEATAEMERSYVQMAELRVEQVTEKERKRIAGDLHDDLGAKLLTIVHTSESERISTLAREALEEMRLSVRGLTGKPLPVADALADWRAETVSRLGQAGVEVDWRSPTEDVTQQLSARAFVQTTRILREAVSNVIKHSGASHCKVRCTLGQQDFVLVVQDNGRGIPMELDGKLDRGHGMASMKHRAKQMQGQCLVESGPGYGTVIRLTLPLGTA